MRTNAAADAVGVSDGFRPEPVMRPRQQVEAQLRAAILSGVFGRGERFPSEAKLAEQFQVSRATIREALRALVSAGLISTVPGASGGSFVTYLDHHKLGELVSERLNNTLELGSIRYDEVAEFRNMLEIPVARLAAVNRTEAHLTRLHDIIEREKYASVDDPEVPNFNAEFHGVVADASGNRLVATFVAALHRVAHPLGFIETSEEVGRDAVRHHIAIVSAIKAQDPDLAEKRMTQHLEYLREHVTPPADSRPRRKAARVAPSAE
ncbi:FadR family transcriptional regulator [Amycolatopsis sp. K13G38]|uniref:FadR family transcriptional regulator n=1 Tax=Amycolatopsis acididurans TaxID=2724524 RepID=A0ABX1J8K2_9PSEU|nr:FadR/GntR family transcriptional regulator [Amycolatopsis acididurans]NKQ56121.1 FadR family transcriptional regulator [Amycolatopsis acididurans]